MGGFEEQVLKITENTEYVKSKLDNELLKLNDGLKNLTKETTYKITDFEELLKNRATEKFVEVSVEAGNRDMEIQLNNFKNEYQRKLDKLNSFIQTLPAFAKDQAGEINKLENEVFEENVKVTTLAEEVHRAEKHMAEVPSMIDEIDKQKIENINMKMQDIQNMCNDLSTRHEETRKMVESLYDKGEVTRLFEVNITKKVEGHNHQFEQLQKLIQMLDKKIKGMGNMTSVNTNQVSQVIESKASEIDFQAMAEPMVGGVSSDEFDKLTQQIDTMQTQMEKDKEEWS